MDLLTRYGPEYSLLMCIYRELLAHSIDHPPIHPFIHALTKPPGLSEKDFSGHSFRKGTAQHAADHGMLDESIQRLGRWSSNAFKLYFTTTPEALFNLNLSFQKRVPLAVPRSMVQTLGSRPAALSVTTNAPEKDIYNSPYPPLPAA